MKLVDVSFSMQIPVEMNEISCATIIKDLLTATGMFRVGSDLKVEKKEK